METKEINKQEALRQFVSREVLANQTMLVEELLSREIASYDEIENYYKTDQQLKEDGYTTKAAREEARGNGEDTNEIYEWWLVSEWLIKKLSELNQPILETGYETWWGRTCTGQAIFLDGVIEKIYDDIKYK